MNIAIIPGLFYDDDFMFFEKGHYEVFGGVLNDVLANMVRRYIDNPNAEQKVVNGFMESIGTVIMNYTFHTDLQQQQILELIKNIQPEGILKTDKAYQDTVLEKLTYLENNVDRVITMIPRRTTVQWDRWKATCYSVNAIMNRSGATWKVPDFFKKLEANKSLFYEPREKDISLPSNAVLTRRNSWMMALRAIQWGNYCSIHGIDFTGRMSF